jgi:hypothetical protein
MFKKPGVFVSGVKLLQRVIDTALMPLKMLHNTVPDADRFKKLSHAAILRTKMWELYKAYY